MRPRYEKLSSIIEGAVRSFNTAGPLRTLQRAVERTIPQHIFSINLIVAIEDSIAEVYEGLGDRVPDSCYRQRWSTEADVEALSWGGQTSAQVRAYFDAHARAVITTLDDEMVGYAWLMTEDWTSHEWLRVNLAADEVWGGYIQTAPAHRGKRLLAGVRKFAYPKLIAEGYERVLVFVDALNRSSLRGGLSPGRRYVGRIFYVRVLKFVIYRIGGKWGAGFWNRRRPYKFSFDVFDRDGPSWSPSALSSE